MSKPVGGITYEGRYFITLVPDEWIQGQPLPAASPEDQWFTSLPEFMTALAGPWSRERVNRRPWTASTDTAAIDPPTFSQ